jgi:hypothetical protein
VFLEMGLYRSRIEFLVMFEVLNLVSSPIKGILEILNLTLSPVHSDGYFGMDGLCQIKCR